MIWTSLVIVGLMTALAHAWHRAIRAEAHYRKLCLIATAVTMHHGKVDGLTIELTAPAQVPACELEFITQIFSNDHVCMRVELKPPTVQRRKREPAPLGLEEDVAAALA